MKAKKFLKIYVIYFISIWVTYGLSVAALSWSEYFSDAVIGGEGESGYKLSYVPIESFRNFKKAFKNFIGKEN